MGNFLTMRSLFLLFVFLISNISFGQKNPNTIGFTENKGQIIDQKGKENKAVLYLLNTPGLNVQLKKNAFSYDIYEMKKVPLNKKDRAFLDNRNKIGLKEENCNYSIEYNYHRIDIDFLNSNTDVKLVAEEKSSDYDNYYNVIHAPEGITNVYKYKKVTYKNIYNNIDAIFFIPKDTTKVVEYNFIVKPGGKVSDIQLKFNGAKTELADNKIRMKVRFGEMEETLPLSWVEQGTSRKEIAVGYKKIKKNVYGFEGDVNASDKTIVIDPVPIRLWGTYYGGEKGAAIHNVITDGENNILISGNSDSANNIATNGTFQSTIWTLGNPNTNNRNGFVAKFNPSGVRLWGTYIGTAEGISILDTANDNLNNIVITGVVMGNSNNITTPNCYQPIMNYQVNGGGDNIEPFIIKFDNNGLRVWGTYYGGISGDYANSVTIDRNNNIYISGTTYSPTGLASPGAHKMTFNNQSVSDGFIAKFNPNGNRIWGTYFGGEWGDSILESAVDVSNNIYFVGLSYSSTEISTPNGFQPNSNGQGEGFLVKFSENGNLVWGTYYGGERSDSISSIKISSNNNIFITGETSSTQNIATSNSFLSNFIYSSYGDNGFLAKFDSNGNRIWATYFYIWFVDFDLDFQENIYFVGATGPQLGIATPNAYKSSPDALDAFLQKFDTNGNRIWGTYYGGNGGDNATAIAFDKTNQYIYFGGTTNSNDQLSTPGSHLENISFTGVNGFLVKFQGCLSSPRAAAQNPCIGSNLELTASGGSSYSWSGPNGFISTDQNPVITNANATHSGQYTCIITGTGGCDGPVTVNVVVGDALAPIPNMTTLPTINGDCNTTITTIPTATDNCAGNIIATTTSPLNYSLPGTYTIVWNYNDGNGNIATQNQTVIISATTLPTLSSSQQFCFQQNATLNNITITGQNIKWYDAPTGGNLLANTTLLQNGTTYYASQTINNCESS